MQYFKLKISLFKAAASVEIKSKTAIETHY